MTSSAFQRTFQHLATANALLNYDPPLPPPLHPALLPTTPAGPTPLPPPSDTEINIIQGGRITRRFSSMLDSATRKTKNPWLTVDSPGDVSNATSEQVLWTPLHNYTINDAFHCL